ncbi:MAG: CBS domain-containing protein [Desulfamplus sp.]|nr:CBS domain-containing protein [Desulfamplus sp.]
MDNVAKSLMIPISEYATISEGATLLDALLSLEQSKLEVSNAVYPHWIILVLNSENRVIGKLSQINVLNALEPKSDYASTIGSLRNFGFSSTFINKLREGIHSDNASLEKIYTDPKIINMNVSNFMRKIAQNDFIDENTSLANAAHQMSVRKKLSMLVTKNDEVVGVLRLSDVFNAVINAIKNKNLEYN